MENTKPFPRHNGYNGYNTGICERIHSKRTLISAISDLKKLLNEKVYIFREEGLKQATFSDSVNHAGCIYLKGLEIQGRSLYDYYMEYTPERYFSQKTRRFMTFIERILKTSEVLREVTGTYPYLMLNSVHITSDGGEVTYLPPSIVDFINKHHTAEVQKLLYYCTTLKKAASVKRRDRITEPSSITTSMQSFDFARAVARLLYLFLSKGGNQAKYGVRRSSPESGAALVNTGLPVFYLREFVDDIPVQLSDAVWNLMHDRGVYRGSEQEALADFREIIGKSKTPEKSGEVRQKIPLSRRSSFILIRSRVLTFIAGTWKYILIAVVVALLLLYLLSDLFIGREKHDYLKGLSPRQVVELYYSAVNNLDLDAVDAVFYRRAGKDIRNELATLVVMMRMEQAFGRRLIQPEQLNNMEYLPEDYTVFGIDGLSIKHIVDGEETVFFATYRRVISSEGTVHEYPVEETIYLKKIDDYWYITKSVRNVKEKQ